MGGTTLNQIVVVLGSLLLARIYSPADMGIWTVFLTSVLLFGPLLTFRYESAIVLPNEDSIATHVIFLSCTLTVLVTLLALFVSVFYSSQIATWINVPTVGPWLWLGTFLLLAAGLNMIANSWLIRQKQFTVMATSLLVKSLITLSIQIGFGYVIGANFVWLIWGTVLGQLAMSSYLTGSILKYELTNFIAAFSWQGMLSVAKRYKNFPLYKFPYSIVDTSNRNLIILLLGIYFTSVEVGLYAMAFRLTYMPVGLISGSLREVFFQKSAVEFGTQEFEFFVRRMLVLLTVVIISPAILFIFNAEEIFYFVVGSEWIGSAHYAAWLTLPCITLTLTAWLNRLYDVTGNQRLAFQLEFGYGIFILIGTIISSKFSSTPLTVAIVFSLITVMYNLIWLGVTFWVSGFSRTTFWQFYSLFFALAIFNVCSYLVTERYFPPIGSQLLYLSIAIGFNICIFANYYKQEYPKEIEL